jgi:uncharacterized protein YfiM (DUF2279 family)
MWSKLKIKILRWVVKSATYLGVPSDKVLHFVCSALIMAMCSIFLNPMLSSFITIAIGLLKELYDCHKPNPTGWDWHDLLADLLGMVAVLVVVIWF